jgi:chromosomal replication initiator protein
MRQQILMNSQAYIFPGLPVSRKTNNISPVEIINTVCEYLEVNFQTLKSKKRYHNLVYARQLCHYFLRDLTNLRVNEIANLVGKFDHATVNHGCNKIREYLDVDKSVQIDVAQIRMRL